MIAISLWCDIYNLVIVIFVNACTVQVGTNYNSKKSTKNYRSEESPITEFDFPSHYKFNNVSQ